MNSWANIKHNEVSSFRDVMDEQLAHQMQSEIEKQAREKSKSREMIDDDLALKLALEESMLETESAQLYATGGCEPTDVGLLPLNTEQHPDTDSDLFLAQMLQNEWNKEHNALLRVQERLHKGNSKVTVSLEKYRCDETADDAVDDSDDIYDSSEDDLYESVLISSSGTPSCQAGGRHTRHKTGIDEPTKHDAEICGKKNTAKLMELPEEFTSGDSRDLSGVKLSNVAYNKLMAYCKSESKRAHRLHEKKEHSTADHALDAGTRLLLYKMVNNRLLEAVNGIMAVGKESVVVHADGGDLEDMDIPRDCAVKIYKTTLTEFKNREIYVRGDHRFSKDEFSKQNPRRIIKMWASKEKANLKRMKTCGVPCPSVVMLSKHVLVMSLIGSDGQAAPQLKTADLSPVDAQIAYDQTITIMKKLHEECKLVHADLSQYNLLWHEQQVYVIDVSQAVELTHPLAMQFLYRDCRNVTHYFSSVGVYHVPTPEALFCHITGMDVHGEGDVFLSNIRQFEKENRKFAELPDKERGTPYRFDYFYELTSTEEGGSHHEDVATHSNVDTDSLSCSA